MQVQDVITYKQKIIQNITDKEVAHYFYDNDYGILLQFLRTGPKTIKDIEDEYKRQGNVKSDKTIYRYIKTLQENELVVEAGKRIFTDEEHRNKSLSIYMRTAKVFIDDTKDMGADEKKKKEVRKIAEAYKLLMDALEEEHDFTVDSIEEIIRKVSIEGQELAVDLMDKADEEIFELLKDYSFAGVNDFLLNLQWFIMLHKSDLKSKLTKC